jgi:scyllo-inositol 2-dehydrogenase (NADP+)
MPHKPIRAGVLGLGRSGWDIHVLALRNDPRFKIVGVTDGVASRCRQAESELHCPAFKRAADLLESVKMDLVVNALPTQDHASLSTDALRAGMHVVVEKPVAGDAAEARRMLKTARSTRKKLFPHHNYRYHPIIRHLAEIVDSGILGELFEIKFSLAQFARRNDWQTLRRNQGGLMNNHGTHHIDWVMQLMRSPIQDVFSDLKLISDSGNTEDHVRIILRAQNGCLADFHLSTATAAELPIYMLLGTCGTLVSDGGTSTIRYFDPKKVKELPVVTGPPELRTYGNDDRMPWREKKVKSVSRDKSTFYDNVYDVLRRRKAMAVTMESVIEVLKVLDRARAPVKKLRPKYGK